MPGTAAANAPCGQTVRRAPPAQVVQVPAVPNQRSLGAARRPSSRPSGKIQPAHGERTEAAMLAPRRAYESNAAHLVSQKNGQRRAAD